jgi:Tfp pilus assembly protein PilN
MIIPNLASRPFLNTRPVWLVTLAAGALALLLVSANVRLYFDSSQSHMELLLHREQLELEHRALEGDVRKSLDELDAVPWRRLASRVDNLNLILREHAFSWIVLLNDIEGVLPREVRLIKISPKVEKDGAILNIQGVARSREGMLDFMDNLIADPRFAKPLPSSEVPPEGGKTVGYLFSLRVDYSPLEEVTS